MVLKPNKVVKSRKKRLSLLRKCWILYKLNFGVHGHYSFSFYSIHLTSLMKRKTKFGRKFDDHNTDTKLVCRNMYLSISIEYLDIRIEYLALVYSFV